MLNNEEIKLIRHFNRKYVLALGVLNKQIFNTDLSWPEGRILEEIGNKQPIKPISIASSLKIDKSYTSRIINKLVKKELVTKQPSLKDARSIQLMLTDKGQKVFLNIDQRSTAQIQEFISDLTPAEQRQFFDCIQTINHLLFEGKNNKNVEN